MKIRCYLCDKPENVYECKYCKQNFCKEHILAKRAGLPRFNSTKPEDIEFMEDFHKQGGHPCLPYTDYITHKSKKEKEEQDRKYGEALNKLRKSNLKPKEQFDSFEDEKKYNFKNILSRKRLDNNKKYSFPVKAEPSDMERYTTNKKEFEKETWSKKHNSKSIKVFVWIIAILILLTILFFVLNHQRFFQSKTLSKEELSLSKLALSKINSIREENNLLEIKENDKAFDMALYLCQNYFNSASDFNDKNKNEIAKKFNVLGEIFIFSYELNETKGYNIDYIITRWTSVGLWKENLLNNKYKFGAVVCHNSVCYFVISSEEFKDKKNIEFNVPLSSPGSNLTDQSENNLVNLKSPLQPDIDIRVYTLENKIHSLINQQRANNGLSPLSLDNKLSGIARAHSSDMAINNYFEHTNLQGKDPTDRAKAVGYSCFKDYGSYYTEGIAENIFQNNLYDSVSYGVVYVVPYYVRDWNSLDEIAQSTVDGWMNSPGHRQNILTADYDKEGIGVAISSDDEVLITEDFC